MKIEVRLIKCVNTDISVLSPSGITTAVRMERQRIYRSEMSFQTSELFLEYEMEKSRIKLPMTSRGRGHVHGVLSTAKYHLETNKHYNTYQSSSRHYLGYFNCLALTWSRIGDIVAELTGLSVLYVLRQTSDSLSNSLAVWSLDAVTNNVPSLLVCMSLIWLLWLLIEFSFFPVWVEKNSCESFSVCTWPHFKYSLSCPTDWFLHLRVRWWWFRQGRPMK